MRLPSVCKILTIWRKHKYAIVFPTAGLLVLVGWYNLQKNLSTEFAKYEKEQLALHAQERKLSEARKKDKEMPVW